MLLVAQGIALGVAIDAFCFSSMIPVTKDVCFMGVFLTTSRKEKETFIYYAQTTLTILNMLPCLVFKTMVKQVLLFLFKNVTIRPCS